MPYYDFRAGSAFPLWNVFQRGISSKTVPFLGKHIHEKHLITYTCGKSTPHKFLARKRATFGCCNQEKILKGLLESLSRKVSCKTKESPVTEISAGSRPWDRGGQQGRSSRGSNGLQNTFFRPFGLKFGVEKKRGRGPRAPLLAPPLETNITFVSRCLYFLLVPWWRAFSNTVCAFSQVIVVIRAERTFSRSFGLPHAARLRAVSFSTELVRWVHARASVKRLSREKPGVNLIKLLQV